jgi:hypothetical protein
MKDQYAGDINDYLKYSLLRALARVHPGQLRVCWMRTASDGRSDGARLSYLDDRDGLGRLDPSVFEALAAMVRSGRRSVKGVETSGVLKGASFHPRLLSDAPDLRRRYFERLWETLGSEDLVFFDPDNGLEIRSVPHGRRNSCKYLYWHELEHALAEQRSVCVYQHFPRVQRAAFIDARLADLQHRFPRHRAFAVSSPWVAHLVCGLPATATMLRREAERLADRSSGRLAVRDAASGRSRV